MLRVDLELGTILVLVSSTLGLLIGFLVRLGKLQKTVDELRGLIEK
jgi:hypothetical protein